MWPYSRFVAYLQLTCPYVEVGAEKCSWCYWNKTSVRRMKLYMWQLCAAAAMMLIVVVLLTSLRTGGRLRRTITKLREARKRRVFASVGLVLLAVIGVYDYREQFWSSSLPANAAARRDDLVRIKQSVGVLPADLNQVASTLRSVSRGTGHGQSKDPAVTPMLQPAAVAAPDGSRMQLHMQLRGTARVLYAVATCSAPGFPPIVDAIFETWGSDLPRKQLVLAGGLKDDFIEGLAEEETPCGDKGGDFWCKEAVTLWRGAQRAKELNAGWLCVSQEDKYIWTDAVDKEFSKFDPSVPGVYGA